METTQLKKELSKGVTEFAFIKKDGSVRIAKGTTNLNLIPNEKHPKGKAILSEKVISFFDLDKSDWRCLSANTEFITK